MERKRENMEPTSKKLESVDYSQKNGDNIKKKKKEKSTKVMAFN